MAGAVAQRIRLLWRRGSRDPAIAASGFTILLVAFVITVRSWVRDSPSPAAGEGALFHSSEPDLVDLTLVHNAEEKGAVCLDGSPPGYRLQRGSGSGSGSWLLHLEGGGWCSTVESCSARARTRLGSTHFMESQELFVGILSGEASQNPDFYNWNRVKIRYCDGASFSGDVESEIHNGTQLFFRGKRIWEAIMSELLLEGLANAKQAFLTGCSAGGLATFIHCDGFRALLPNVATVKCFSDGGYFLDEKDVSGKTTIRSFYEDVVNLQDVAKSLHKDCISRNKPSQCFFPREIIKSIKTPFFILNPAYDFWQIQHVFAPPTSDPQNNWLSCKLNIRNCNEEQIKSLQGFRTSMLDALSEFKHDKDGGMLINSCFAHCQTISKITWHAPYSPRVNNKTIAEAVGDWYFDRNAVKEVDCPFPCNPTCYNVGMTIDQIRD